MEMDEHTMINSDVSPMLLLLPICFSGGFAMGIVYFRTIRITADMIVSGQRPMLVIALAIGRLALLVCGFALALQAGGFGILVTLAGVIGGREMIIRIKWGARP
jgi:uncharacterized membrane-anchored protein